MTGSGRKPNPFGAMGLRTRAPESRRARATSLPGSARAESRGSWSAAGAQLVRRVGDEPAHPLLGLVRGLLGGLLRVERGFNLREHRVQRPAERSDFCGAGRLRAPGAPGARPAICPGGQLDVVERPQAALGRPPRRRRRGTTTITPAHDQVEDLKPGGQRADVRRGPPRARRFTVPALNPANCRRRRGSRLPLAAMTRPSVVAGQRLAWFSVTAAFRGWPSRALVGKRGERPRFGPLHVRGS